MIYGDVRFMTFGLVHKISIFKNENRMVRKYQFNIRKNSPEFQISISISIAKIILKSIN
jgi:hypothetical protein